MPISLEALALSMNSIIPTNMLSAPVPKIRRHGRQFNTENKVHPINGSARMVRAQMIADVNGLIWKTFQIIPKYLGKSFSVLGGAEDGQKQLHCASH